ncbi:MAG: hypothetical protein E7082_01070 [Bacteroidales bacterium]|nr:hypothetical protein [Bacteroidales bacterium]
MLKLTASQAEAEAAVAEVGNVLVTMRNSTILHVQSGNILTNIIISQSNLMGRIFVGIGSSLISCGAHGKCAALYLNHIRV